MKKLYLLGIGLFISILHLNAQSIKNVQASSSGSKVIILYDLIGLDKDQKFDVVIKSSNDGFSSVLKEVTGDIGADQSVGNEKKIIWDAGKELRVFKGDISFEITATVTFTPLKFVKPATATGVKIGKPYTMKWIGGTLDKNLKLELLKNNSQVIDMGDVKNTGSYTWNVPKTMEKGERFQFKLLDPNKANNAVLSAEFNLKKTSMLLYVGAGVVVAGVLVAVIAGGGGDEPGSGQVDCSVTPNDPACQTGTTSEPLPEPPVPGS